MFKFAAAAVLSGALALAAIPQQAQAGGKGIALGVGLGLGAAVLMHGAHKQQQAAARQRAARQRAASKKAAYARKKQAEYARQKQAAIAARKRELARQAAIAKQKQLARQEAVIEAKEEALVAAIELPAKKPEVAEEKVAKVETSKDEDFETVANLNEPTDLQPASYDDERTGNLDCKRYIPSAGLTISVPCGQ
ncbi:MAG: hypothetical protein APF80_08720 [Alphaproteobacteria bacterium BRH_c36]|nr:MAG: hypothetical protein APF80_08720 [Alphaproteobacteria bacterium BRH_c36]